MSFDLYHIPEQNGVYIGGVEYRSLTALARDFPELQEDGVAYHHDLCMWIHGDNVIIERPGHRTKRMSQRDGSNQIDWADRHLVGIAETMQNCELLLDRALEQA